MELEASVESQSESTSPFQNERNSPEWLSSAAALLNQVVNSTSTSSSTTSTSTVSGSISGRVFRDRTGTGVMTATSPGQGGIVVQLLSATGRVIKDTVTDSYGNYRFARLGSGTYQVRLELESGTIQTAGPSLLTRSVTASTASLGNNFSVFQLGTVSGYVFDDLNNDQAFSYSGEPTLEGRIICLLDMGGNTVQQVLSDSNGEFRFTGVMYGVYTVVEVNSAGSIIAAAPSSVILTSGASVNRNVPSAPGNPALDPSRILRPGDGFDGATARPASYVTGAGSTAEAIARWDVVPYQTFSTTMNVGVVAFHVNDIRKVSFSVNGGAWLDVTSMSLNPETNVVEYWVTLRASDFADGPVEVRAIAYPKVGVPRVLQGAIPTETKGNGEHSMWLYADADGSSNSGNIYVAPSTGNDTNLGTAKSPVKTLAQALTLAGRMVGARIILTEPGKYNPDRPLAPVVNNTQWITIEPATNLSADQVSIGGGGESLRIATRTDNIHWKNLTFETDTYSAIFARTQWYDSCRITSPAETADDVIAWRGNVYFTDSRIERTTYGFVAAQLVRNSVVRDVYDAFQNSQMVLNCDIEQMLPDNPAAHHPDVFQTWGAQENMVIYGLTGRNISATQVLFLNQPLAIGPKMKDVAVVNVSIETLETAGGPPFSQLQGPMSHVLFKNVSIPNQALIFRTDVIGKLNFFSGKNISFQDCTFSNRFHLIKLPPGVTMNNAIR